MSKEFKYDKTKGKTRQIVCNRCDLPTNHRVCNSVTYSYDDGWLQGNEIYEVVQCLGCDQLSFRIGSQNSEDYEPDEEGNLVYPESEEVFPSRLMGRTPIEDIYYLPEKVRSVYNETHRAVTSNLKILAAVGIRALVETVCRHKKSGGRNLKQRIDGLVKKNILTQRSASILHRTRFLGNKSAHEVSAPSESELKIAFDIVENLLQNVYIIPLRVAQLKKRRKRLTPAAKKRLAETTDDNAPF